MAELYSQYASGAQLPAGAITGSTLGASGLNPMVDRLNSISTANNLITGSVVSGTATVIYGNGFPNNYTDSTPKFTGKSYYSPDIYAGSNVGRVNLKPSAYANPTGSIVWELFGATTSDTVNSTDLGSLALSGIPLAVVYNRYNGNVIYHANGDNKIYIISGPDNDALVGSFAEPAQNVLALAIDYNTGNLISAGLNHTRIHSGISATIIGSYAQSLWGMDINPHTGDLIGLNSTTLTVYNGLSNNIRDSFLLNDIEYNDSVGVAYDYDNNNTLVVGGGSFVHVYEGVSRVLLGSFGAIPNAADGWSMTYAGNGSVLIGNALTDHLYKYDLGMGSEVSLTVLTPGSVVEGTPVVDADDSPIMRLRATRSNNVKGAHELNSVALEYN